MLLVVEFPTTSGEWTFFVAAVVIPVGSLLVERIGLPGLLRPRATAQFRASIGDRGRRLRGLGNVWLMCRGTPLVSAVTLARSMSRRSPLLPLPHGPEAFLQD